MSAPHSDTKRQRPPQPRTPPRQPLRPTTIDWQFFSEENFAGRRPAFARAGTEIPRLHPGRPGAHRLSPDPVCSDRGDPGAQLQRRLDTTPPARWWNPPSAPSVQVSCRLGIAEHSNYNFILRFEVDKRLVLLHRRESGWTSEKHESCRWRETLLDANLRNRNPDYLTRYPHAWNSNPDARTGQRISF